MPKAFIASTCNDIPELREAIIKQTEEIGYEPVYCEKWSVPKGYHSHDVCIGKVNELHSDVDVYVLIISKRYGGKYSGNQFLNFFGNLWKEYLQKFKERGTGKYKSEREQIQVQDISITWAETIMAYKKGVPVLPFISESVWNERATYKKNPGIRPVHTDTHLTFHFIDYICYQDKDNWCQTYSCTKDIKDKLKYRISGIGLPKREYKDIFRYTFKKYPEILFYKNTLDLAVIFPAGEREKNALVDARDKDMFTSNQMRIKLRGEEYFFQRTVRAGASIDILRIGDLLMYLLNVHFEKTKKESSFSLTTPICYMDTAIPESILDKNLIVIGGGDTNSFRCVVSVAFQKKYGRPIPIRFVGEDKFIFQSENIYSELSEKLYQEQAGTEHYHCGSIVMIPNPWNNDKVVILAAGNIATGTQASILALIARKGFTLKNNKVNHCVPAKVVRAIKAKAIPSGEYSSSPFEEVNFRNRITARHFITGVEFLE